MATGDSFYEQSGIGQGVAIGSSRHPPLAADALEPQGARS